MRLNATLLNPLPLSLRHYVAALKSMTEQSIDWREIESQGVEVHQSGSNRAQLATAYARTRRSASREGPLILAWPAFGHLEPLLSTNREATALVFHDPTPLRRQAGYGAIARSIGAAIANRKPSFAIVAHSKAAAQMLRCQGYRGVHYVPHPIDPVSQSHRQPTAPTVRILGAYKRARRLHPLPQIGRELRRMGYLTEIVGRAWPPVDGWDVRSEFVGETEFERLLTSSSAILVLYDRYYQSGVAVRALESGVPIVGEAEGYLSELYGADWAGLVSGESDERWMRAILGAIASRDQVRDIHRVATRTATDAWVDLVGRMKQTPIL